VTGFEIDAEVPTILKLKSGAQAWDHTGIKAAFDKMDRVPPSIPRKTRAKLFGMHGFNSLTPAKQASHGWVAARRAPAMRWRCGTSAML